MNREQLEAIARIAMEENNSIINAEPRFDTSTVSGLEQQLEYERKCIIELDSDVVFLRNIIQLMQQGRHDQDNNHDERKRKVRWLENEIRKLQIRAVEENYLKSLDPDFTNPELIRLIGLLESTFPRYKDMDDYQVEDVVFMLDRWLRTRNQTPDINNIFTRGIINANDTGMGKTMETAAFLHVMRQNNPNMNVIWFTKTSLKGSSARECNNKWGFPLIPVSGQTSSERVTFIRTMQSVPFPMTLCINYEAVTVKSVRNALLETNWDFMVIDEVHKLRGGASATPTNIWIETKFFKEQSKAFPIMLSGSIINNEAEELFAYLNIMDDERFPDRMGFRNAFKSGLMTKEKLMRILAPSMFRRTKAEVSIKMPERIIQKHTIEYDPSSKMAQLYDSFTESMWAQIDTDKSMTLKSMLQLLHYQRTLNVAPGWMFMNRDVIDPISLETTTIREQIETGTPTKLDYAAELAFDLAFEGQQVVVATAQYKAPLDYISAKLTAMGITNEILAGDTTKYGSEIEQRFQQGTTMVLLTNIPSGGEGFNFHADPTAWPGGASNLIMVDDWYNPQKISQMFDRVWRRGSLNRVMIHLLQMEDSVDLFVEGIREAKDQRNIEITEDTALRAGEWKTLLMETMGRKPKFSGKVVE